MEPVWLAIIVLASTVFTTIVAPLAISRAARSDEVRRERRQDEVAIRLQVENVRKEQEAKTMALLLAKISDVSEKTHKIVNNQRTVMLRQVAVLSRLYANDHPENKEAQIAAENAEIDARNSM